MTHDTHTALMYSASVFPPNNTDTDSGQGRCPMIVSVPCTQESAKHMVNVPQKDHEAVSDKPCL